MKYYIIVREFFRKRTEQLFAEIENVTITTEKDLSERKNNDLTDFTILFEESDDMIIAVDPSVIGWSLPKDILKRLPNLKGIATRSAWMEYIDLDYCKKNNIQVKNTPNANSQAVAEHGIWMMMCLAKKLPLIIKDNFETKQDMRCINLDLKGKKLGVIGLGNIGSKVADMGAGLGMNVIYWNRNKKKSDHKSVNLGELLSSADFVFNCLEICKGTDNLLSAKYLAKMKRSSCYITIVGGLGWKIADEEFLLNRLIEGKIAGLASENHHHKDFEIPEELIQGYYNLFLPPVYAWFTENAQNKMDELWKKDVLDIAEET